MLLRKRTIHASSWSTRCEAARALVPEPEEINGVHPSARNKQQRMSRPVQGAARKAGVLRPCTPCPAPSLPLTTLPLSLSSANSFCTRARASGSVSRPAPSSGQRLVPPAFAFRFCAAGRTDPSRRCQPGGFHGKELPAVAMAGGCAGEEDRP